MGRERELPPPLEMACLNALWQLGEGNVEDVRKLISQPRPLAYTTVLTLLDRLSRRGAVSRRRAGRGFRYQPVSERDKVRRIAVRQLVDMHFEGSPVSLMAFLETHPPPPEEPAAPPITSTEIPKAMAASAAGAGVSLTQE
jgi:predicted transcriptional regulator